MDILDEIIDCFTLTIDKALMSSLRHNQATEMLNQFCTEQLSEEQSAELNEIVGRLSSAIFVSSAKAGMKLGALIVAELLSGGGDRRV